MKVLRYDEIPRTSLFILEDRAYEMAEKMAPRLAGIYPTMDNKGESHASTALTLQLDPLLWATNGNLKGKTILDLGCGSNDNYIDSFAHPDSMFEPWLCRALLLLDAKPIGVDFGPLGKEKFEFYRRDLSAENSLEMIPDNSVDVANAKMLFDSPYLVFTMKRDVKKMQKNLITQLERIVKPEGYFIHMECK